jgi:hypothetical protein
MAKRQIEIFTANYLLCDETVRTVQELACSNCEVLVYDLRSSQEQQTYLAKAEHYGVQSVPAMPAAGVAIAINGVLVLIGKPTRDQLLAVGVGQPLN